MQDTIANMNSFLVYFLLLLIGFTGGWILFHVNQSFENAKSAAKGGKGKGLFGRMGCLATLFFTLLLLTLIFFTAFRQAYSAFTKEELVATVECQRALDHESDFIVGVRLVKDGQLGDPSLYAISGNQWTIEGDVIQWHNWVRFTGMNTMYRLTRVRGRYTSAQDERTKKASVHSLHESENSAFWKMMHGVGDLMFFVRSSYGSATFTYPSYTDLFEVYVTGSGFKVQRVRGERKQDVLGRVLNMLPDDDRPDDIRR